MTDSPPSSGSVDVVEIPQIANRPKNKTFLNVAYSKSHQKDILKRPQIDFGFSIRLLFLYYMDINQRSEDHESIMSHCRWAKLAPRPQQVQNERFNHFSVAFNHVGEAETQVRVAKGRSPARVASNFADVALRFFFFFVSPDFPFKCSLWNQTGSQYLQVMPLKSQRAPFQGTT